MSAVRHVFAICLIFVQRVNYFLFNFSFVWCGFTEAYHGQNHTN